MNTYICKSLLWVFVFLLSGYSSAYASVTFLPSQWEGNFFDKSSLSFNKINSDHPCVQQGYSVVACPNGHVLDPKGRCSLESDSIYYKQCVCNSCSGYAYTYAEAYESGYLPDGDGCLSCDQIFYKRKVNTCEGYNYDKTNCGIDICQDLTGGECQAGDVVKYQGCVPCPAKYCDTGTVSKGWLIDQAAKQNGVVVSTVQELKDAVNNNKELIVVYGKISVNLENDFSGSIVMQKGQKLVGTEYFAHLDKELLYRCADGKRISELNLISTVSNNKGITMTSSSLLSDIGINYMNMAENGDKFAVYLNAADGAEIKNVAVDLEVEDGSGNRAAISADKSGTINLAGEVKISTYGKRGHGLYIYNGPTMNIANAKLIIKTQGLGAYGILAQIGCAFNVNSGALIDIETLGGSASGINNSSANFSINSGTEVNIKTSGVAGYGILNSSIGTLLIAPGAEVNIDASGEIGIGIYTMAATTDIAYGSTVNIKALGNGGFGINTHMASTTTISGTVNSKSHGYGMMNTSDGNNMTRINSTGKVFMEVTGDVYSIFHNNGLLKGSENVLMIDKGAKIGMRDKNGNVSWREAVSDFIGVNSGSTAYNYFYNTPMTGLENTTAWTVDLGGV